eukprot:2556214-Amphidinium_carterae.1
MVDLTDGNSVVDLVEGSLEVALSPGDAGLECDSDGAGVPAVRSPDVSLDKVVQVGSLVLPASPGQVGSDCGPAGVGFPTGSSSAVELGQSVVLPPVGRPFPSASDRARCAVRCPPGSVAHTFTVEGLGPLGVPGDRERGPLGRTGLAMDGAELSGAVGAMMSQYVAPPQRLLPLPWENNPWMDMVLGKRTSPLAAALPKMPPSSMMMPQTIVPQGPDDRNDTKLTCAPL